jgi:hypothetical protein
MKIEIYHIKGKTINKAQFSIIEDYAEKFDKNTNQLFALMADEKEHVYFSNGFKQALTSSYVSKGEWHHYFKKDGRGGFDAGKVFFKATN